MSIDSSNFNHKVVGRTGIAFAVFQLLAATAGLFALIYTVITPDRLLGFASRELFDINLAPVGGLLFFPLILLLVTIGLTIGVYRRNVVCAFLLLVEVASYPIAAV